jgi:type IV secretory pathway ATPase VirB11/archaellum biosynthesis ATPase
MRGEIRGDRLAMLFARAAHDKHASLYTLHAEGHTIRLKAQDLQ